MEQKNIIKIINKSKNLTFDITYNENMTYKTLINHINDNLGVGHNNILTLYISYVDVENGKILYIKSTEELHFAMSSYKSKGVQLVLYLDHNLSKSQQKLTKSKSNSNLTLTILPPIYKQKINELNLIIRQKDNEIKSYKRENERLLCDLNNKSRKFFILQKIIQLI